MSFHGIASVVRSSYRRKPDFYIIGHDTYKNKYKSDLVENVQQKNAKMWNELHQNVSGIDKLIQDNPDNRFRGARKQAPVDMIYLSDLGFSINGQARIIPSYGGAPQVKHAGKEAMLVVEKNEAGEPKFYMVNLDEKTNKPIGYVDYEPPLPAPPIR